MPTKALLIFPDASAIAEVNRYREQLNELIRETAETVSGASTPMIVCSECGEEALERRAIELPNGSLVCGSCSDSYALCSHSNEYFHLDSMRMVRNAHTGDEAYIAKTFFDNAGVWTCCHCNESFIGDQTYVEGEGYCCSSCADDYYRCECGSYWTSEDDCTCGCLYNTNVDTNIHEGADFTRFTQRPVGLELETGEHAADNNPFRRWVKSELTGWGMKPDGSLCETGYEFVSPPMTGDLIEKSYRNFVATAKRTRVVLEDPYAGYHVHVNAKDIYETVKRLHQRSTTAGELAEKVIHGWGEFAVSVVRRFVSPRRRENDFCDGGFALRGGWGRHDYLRTVSSASYPTVAVRSNTFEFRVFPSTATPDYHLARIELAQKMVDWLNKVIQNDTHDKALQRTQRLLNSWRRKKGERRVRFLAKFFGMSKESYLSLLSLYKKWNVEDWGGETYCAEEDETEEETSFAVTPEMVAAAVV